MYVPRLKSISGAAIVGLLFAVFVVMAGFGSYGLTGGLTGLLPIPQGDPPIMEIEDTIVPLAESASTGKVLKPSASGKVARSGGGATIDMSNANEGYVMAKYDGSGKIKVQIKKSGKTTYNFDLKASGGYEVFPLTQGDGKYTISVYKNVSGNEYSLLVGGTVDVKLRASTLPFLYPSQLVNFNEKSKAVEKSNELAKGAADDLAVVKAIYGYVVANTTYDSQKASSVKSGYLPVIDNTLSTKKGICFDYASLTAAMLRAQGIPARLEVGYAGKVYHSWISVYIKNVGWINDMIYFDGKSWKLMDPTFASSGGQSKEIMQYIGNGSNYSTVYIY